MLSPTTYSLPLHLPHCDHIVTTLWPQSWMLIWHKSLFWQRKRKMVWCL